MDEATTADVGSLLNRETPARAHYTYKLPAVIAKKTGVNSITIIELTAGEELMAAKRTQQDPMRLAFESALQSLVAVNGSPVNLVDGSADRAWQQMHPQARHLVMRAYDQLHNVAKKEVDDFLGSQTIEVG